MMALGKLVAIRHYSSRLPEFGVFQKLLADYMSNPERLCASRHAFNLTTADLQTAPEGVKKLCSLAMSDGQQFSAALRRAAIQYFARAPNDTGSPEVQAALCTVRLQLLHRHCSQYRHDYKTERCIHKVYCARKRMLRYLRRIDLHRYHALLDRLGLPATYLEEEEGPYHYFTYNREKPAFTPPKNRTIRGGGWNIKHIK